MLNRKENILMNYIYEKCYGKESVLLTPSELLNNYSPRDNVEQAELDAMIRALQLENYITLVLSEKKGKPIYCISLDKKGQSYLRDRENARKTLIKLIVRTVLLAILSTAVGLIIKAIFK